MRLKGKIEFFLERGSQFNGVRLKGKIESFWKRGSQSNGVRSEKKESKFCADKLVDNSGVKDVAVL